METPTWTAEIRGDKLILDLRDAFGEWVASRRNGRYVLTLKEWRNRRSSASNRWYWGVLLERAVEQSGVEKAIIHERLKERIVPMGDAGVLGIIRTESTADMDQARFAWYCQQACAVLAQEGIDLSNIESAEAW